MEKQSGGPVCRRQEDRPFLSKLGAAGSFSATVIFALYNGGLGLWHRSLWHGSICIYYILLSLLRGVLLAAEQRAGKAAPEMAANCRKKAFYATSGIILVMNAALSTPASLMVLGRRPIRMGLVPAIASAAYTTYKIGAAVVGWRQTRGTILQRELSVLRITDALVSLLVLQNTLIVAVDGGISPQLFRFVAVSSAGILVLIFTISIGWLIRGFLSYRKAP